MSESHIHESMSASPLVSIITPTFNQGCYIKDCIESIKQQTYKNIEHLIFDSCSTDETEDVVSGYLDSYNLSYVREKDQGQADALNKGLSRATGRVVCWLNSDDFFFDNRVIERVINLFQSNALFDVVTGDGYYVDASKKLLKAILTNQKLLTTEHFRTGDYLLQPSTFWKNNSIRMDASLHYTFDWKYFYELFNSGYRYYHARDYFSCYRVHDASKTHIDSARRKVEVARLLKENRASWLCLVWAWTVVVLYRLSESLKLPFIKRATIFCTLALHRLSNGRINSG